MGKRKISQKGAQDIKEATDSQLVKLVQNRQNNIYDEIVHRYQRKLFIYLYHFVGNRDEAEDILQNVFVKSYRNIKRFDTSKKFSSWIYRIAHNEAVNFMKRRNRKRFISWEDIVNTKDKLDTQSPERTPEETWIRKEIKQEVDKALKRLPEKYQEVLKMRYYQTKTYHEMAKILKKPVNTVGTLINRAKKKLWEVITCMEE